MNAYIALLRGINVTGNNKVPMTALKAMCEEIGFVQVKTYIASGNAIFQSKLSEVKVKSALEVAMAAHLGKPIGVMIRTAAEMAEVTLSNPFPGEHASKTLAFFLDDAPPSDTLISATNRTNERIAVGKREIYVHYPEGQGLSRLKLPAAKLGTARNMNTVAKLAEMAAMLG